jgi:hypothetical protein
LRVKKRKKFNKINFLLFIFFSTSRKKKLDFFKGAESITK